MPALLFILGCGAIAVVFIHLRNRSLMRSRLIDRVEETSPPPSGAAGAASAASAAGSRGFLSAWLQRAGLRGPTAPAIFITATLVCLILALLVVLMAFQNGMIDIATDALRGIPGGVGNVMVPFAIAAPWFIAIVVALLPTLYVRSVRRRRVESIQRDLPLLLDLLNTLSQAGIGFDSALDRILAVQPADRPLVQELRSFQRDTLAGRSRLESLRRCMGRVEVPMFSAFLSALIQAEQSGGGMAATLRIQAIEMRSRRRERASAIAMAVPTKLVLPMVIGFLPGIFVILLGPMITQAFGVMNQQLRTVTGQ